MKHCPNCGKAIDQNTKFCPNCGTKISVIQEKSKEGVFTKMEKGAVKSLKNKVQQVVEEKTESVIKETKNDTNSVKPQDNSPYSLRPLLVYILFSIVLFMLGSENDTILGAEIFSVVVLLIYFIRRKKEKPINWLAIIILLLQALLIFSFLMEMSEVLFVNEISSVITLVMIGLLFGIFYLIFNRKKLKQQ